MNATLYSMLSLAGLLQIVHALPYQTSTQELQSKQPLLDGLPSNTNITLRYVALGVGVQNYTCNGTSYVQTQSSDGALATLYDATAYLASNPSAISSLSIERLEAYEASHHCEESSNREPQLPNLGEHFFTSDMVPTFDLFETEPQRKLSAAKIQAVEAPVPDTVSWLYLVDCEDGTSEGLEAAYRVETAKGVAPSSCNSEETGSQVAIAYTAQYWFYE
ncbi:hypothetical protein D0869_00215 [Hortaea werneckii]|uniref:Malate dehydrogenase n=1 Tax=Hortaea werneckii TaxID=91943 RepID=A0A3M6XI01_HORWE|nr:hypothetical protein KC324_g7513 [Hortaea werneckii]KAI7583018.1 hypothetical protein KC316_g7537 [Hortaea werneckii]RMX90301.1 hypothetical protein D0869_00215 [Hortaea werneckii]RMY16821.1 hypothetical protein D0868_00102 [Hortaea werneckii]